LEKSEGGEPLLRRILAADELCMAKYLLEWVKSLSMKKFLVILVSVMTFACNDNATSEKPALDRTDNDDTAAVATDSLNRIDSLRGR